MTASDLIALVGAATGVIAVVVGIGNLSRNWVRTLVLVLVVALVAATIVAIPSARARAPIVSAAIAVGVLIGLTAWYALNRYLDRPPRPSMQLTLDPGQTVHAGADQPLSLHGSYVGDALAVRAVFRDRHGYYVQNPEVDLGSDGRWSATNLRPGHDLDELHLVLVGRRGRRYFDRLVRTNTFGAVPLPKNCRSVLRVPLPTAQIGSQGIDS